MLEVTIQGHRAGHRGATAQPIAAALARFPARERAALLLVTLGGLSYQQAAAALSIGPGTVGSRLTRARAKVRTALGDPTPVLDSTGGT